jgi:hypothetical protein
VIEDYFNITQKQEFLSQKKLFIDRKQAIIDKHVFVPPKELQTA